MTALERGADLADAVAFFLRRPALDLEPETGGERRLLPPAGIAAAVVVGHERTWAGGARARG
ncbi:hypothetical protein ACIA5H_25325 [Nocardia sp. NPDC051900]|uniref:hypothetical protein n=1 Tax=Nocardia sp. NPDC051900 TaxID=3364326 RepID=UPI0037A174BB